MKSSMDQSMQALMQAIVTSNQQTAEAMQAMAETNQKILQAMMAPRKKVKDKTGRTVGVEVEGFGTVAVQ